MARKKHSSRLGKLDDRLVCRVKSLTYDFRSQQGEVFFSEGHCCDMSGCIEMFQLIDPDVKTIQTYSSRLADVVYRIVDGEWLATYNSRSIRVS